MEIRDGDERRLGSQGVLEALLMIPMGLGMSSINAGVMFLEGGKMGTLFVDPLMTNPADLVNIMQINWLQPIYTLTFSNGLIACFVFMGIGVLLDVGYVMARPFQSMFIALFAEPGTFVVFPFAIGLGLTAPEAASVTLRPISATVAVCSSAPRDRRIGGGGRIAGFFRIDSRRRRAV